MTKVVVKDGDLDGAWRAFKVKFAKSGVPSEVKKHKEYKKPGVVRKEKKQEQIRNFRKKNRRKNSNRRKDNKRD